MTKYKPPWTRREQLELFPKSVGTMMADDRDNEALRQSVVDQIAPYTVTETTNEQPSARGTVNEILFYSNIPFRDLRNAADSNLTVNPQYLGKGGSRGLYRPDRHQISISGYAGTPTVTHELGHALHHMGEDIQEPFRKEPVWSDKDDTWASGWGPGPVTEGVADGYKDKYGGEGTSMYITSARGRGNGVYPSVFKVPEDHKADITNPAGYMYAAHRYRARMEGVPHRDKFLREEDFDGHPAIAGPQFHTMRENIRMKKESRLKAQGEQLTLPFGEQS